MRGVVLTTRGLTEVALFEAAEDKSRVLDGLSRTPLPEVSRHQRCQTCLLPESHAKCDLGWLP